MIPFRQPHAEAPSAEPHALFCAPSIAAGAVDVGFSVNASQQDAGDAGMGGLGSGTDSDAGLGGLGAGTDSNRESVAGVRRSRDLCKSLQLTTGWFPVAT